MVRPPGEVEEETVEGEATKGFWAIFDAGGAKEMARPLGVIVAVAVEFVAEGL